MSKYLLAVDPGLQTGVAFLDISDGENPEILWHAELTIEEFYDRIESVFEQYHEELILVWEDFHITVETAKKTPQPWSLHLIGLMLYFCWKYDVPFSINSPSRKIFADNAKLKRVGFWHVGGDGHSNDAFRHAMVFIADNYNNWVRKLLAPQK